MYFTARSRTLHMRHAFIQTVYFTSKTRQTIIFALFGVFDWFKYFKMFMLFLLKCPRTELMAKFTIFATTMFVSHVHGAVGYNFQKDDSNNDIKCIHCCKLWYNRINSNVDWLYFFLYFYLYSFSYIHQKIYSIHFVS